MHQQLVNVAEQKLDESASKDAASQEHADDIQKRLAKVITMVSHTQKYILSHLGVKVRQSIEILFV